MIPFMIGFMISLVPILYAFHLRILSTSGSVALLFIATLVYGFAGLWAFAALALLFIPPALAIVLGRGDPPMYKERTVISLSVIPLFFSVLYFFLPSPTWTLYMVTGYSVAAIDIWRRIAIAEWSAHSYRLFDFKRTDSDTPGTFSPYGLLGVLASGSLFFLFAFLTVPASQPVALILLADAIMYVLLLLLGVLKRRFIFNKAPFTKDGRFHFDEPMLRFLSAAISLIVILLIVSFA